MMRSATDNKSPLVSITNMGEQNALYPLTKSQAKLAARVLAVIYNGPGTATYRALERLAKKEAQ